MTSYESDFGAALNRGRVYDSAEQLRATPEGREVYFGGSLPPGQVADLRRSSRLSVRRL